MKNIQVIFSATSTNGRWGVEVLMDSPPEDFSLHIPQEGTLKALGKVEGKDVFLFTPSASGVWWMCAGDAEALDGAEEIYKTSLQSSDYATILKLGEHAVIKTYGYKRRSSHLTLYVRGEAQDVPAPVLLALGLLPPQEVEEVDNTPPPVTIMGEALYRAGILKGGKP